MHTFFFCAYPIDADCAQADDEPDPMLHQVLSVTQLLTPVTNVPYKVSQRRLAAVRGGWFCLAPDPERPPTIFSESVDQELAVLFYGALDEDPLPSPAQTVVTAWRRGGADAVRRLDGSFSALIVELARRRVVVVSDLIGQRTLRYYVHQGAFYLASHDLPLVATGRCPLDLDLTSAGSITCFDWSLQGRSLLRAIGACHPDEVLTWEGGIVHRSHEPALIPQNRIERHDTHARRDHVIRMVTAMQRGVEQTRQGSATVNAHLTAGFDSRALLALLLSKVDSSQIRLSTMGDEYNLDVQTAKNIAGRYRISHQHLTPAPPAADEFLHHVDLLAYFMNGDTNGKRAAGNPLPGSNVNEAPHFFGTGGELYRGNTYPVRHVQALAQWFPPAVTHFLVRRVDRGNRGSLMRSELLEQVVERLRQVIDGYYEQDGNTADVFDLFYAQERLGRWASLSARCTWWTHYASPFADPTVVRLAFHLPAPIGEAAALHRYLIGHFLRNAYYWPPVNNKVLLPMLNLPRAQDHLGRLIQRGLSFFRKRIQANGNSAQQRNLDQLQGDIFADALYDTVADLLLGSQSIAQDILGRPQTVQVLHEQRQHQRNHVTLLGGLVTMERWLQLARQAASLARAYSSPGSVTGGEPPALNGQSPVVKQSL
jgi:hypothetical protein